MDDSINPLVSVVCTTYNHEAYIRQCLDGFIMQKTDFPFEIIVHDDASTDSTVSIIKEYEDKYPNLFNNIYRTENWFSQKKNIWGYLFTEKARGKYIALCEGDDYWTDPLKLQKQVDFLEANPEYSMCHTSFRYYYEKQNKFLDSKDIDINLKIIQKGLLLEDLLNQYRIQTVTVLFRKNLLEKVLNSDYFLYQSSYFLMGDTQLWFGLFKLGEICFLPEVTSVYRKNTNSITTQKNKKKYFRFNLSSAELRKYLSEKNLFSDKYKQKVEKQYAQALIKYHVFDTTFTPKFPYNKKNIYTIQFILIYKLNMYFVYRFYLFVFVEIRSYMGNLLRFFSKKY